MPVIALNNIFVKIYVEYLHTGHLTVFLKTTSCGLIPYNDVLLLFFRTMFPCGKEKEAFLWKVLLAMGLDLHRW